MPDHIVRLNYPPDLVDVPIIHQLIRRYDITVNILGADISQESGWVEIKVTGSASAIDAAFSWLEKQGIELQTR